MGRPGLRLPEGAQRLGEARTLRVDPMSIAVCLLSSVLLVPDDFPTIQQALVASVDGDEILVRPGTYLEVLDFGGKAVHLRSIAGPATTKIDAGGAGSCVRFETGEGSGSILEGFTLSGGSGTDFGGDPIGGGIFCYDASPRILGNVIEGCTASDGGGIACYGMSSPDIHDNVVRGCFAQGTGGGLALYVSNMTGSVTGNLIEGNEAFSDHGGGIFAFNGSIDLLDNVIVGNRTSQSGGGVMMMFSAGFPPIVSGNRIAGNTAGDDGGGVWCSSTNPHFSRNVVEGNEAPYGGGMYLRNHSIELLHNVFVNNAASVAGGGLFIDGGTSFAARNCILTGNDAPLAPDYDDGGDPVSLEHCLVAGGWPGPGNFDADPFFVDPDGPDDDPTTWLDNDFRLQSNSPCIDAGSPLTDPDPDGSPADVGAIPFDPYDPVPYCVAAVNSAGTQAFIGSLGTTSITSGGLQLTVVGAPPTSFGLFFYGAAATQVPLGAGFRCVAAPLYRLAPIVLSDGGGAASLALDYAAEPLSSGPGAVTAGSTWFFQYWYRELPGGPFGSNLSNGLVVTFQP